MITKETSEKSRIEQLTIACSDLFAATLGLGPEFMNEVNQIDAIREKLRIKLDEAWREYDRRN